MHEAVHEAARRAHADMGEGRGRSEAECKQRQPQARPLHGTLPEFFSPCKKKRVSTVGINLISRRDHASQLSHRSFCLLLLAIHFAANEHAVASPAGTGASAKLC